MRAIVLLLSAIALSSQARADLVLNGTDNANQRTVAARDNLKTWDDVAHYGGSRIEDRPREEFQPDGIRLGNFLFFPSFTVSPQYRQRTIGADDHVRDDWQLVVEPELNLMSRFARHVFNLRVSGEFIASDDEIYDEQALGSAEAFTRIDIDSGHALHATATASRDALDRIDPESPLTRDELLITDTYRARVGLKRDRGRLAAEVVADVVHEDAHDTRDNLGRLVDEDDRDTTRYGAQLNLRYRFSPGYTVLASARGEAIDNRGDGTLSRDATELSAGVGIEAELSPLVRLAFLTRYTSYEFDTDDFADLVSLQFDGEIQWL
ncbi:MAG: outer membrane beta-barrel protein, partial [Pseudomonadota bacterium]